MTEFLQRRLSRPWPWLVFAALLYAPWIKVEPERGNVGSDLAAIESLVERGTFFINDSSFADTLDRFKRGDLFFSQKSPIFHLAAALPAAALYNFDLRMGPNFEVFIWALTLLFSVLPMGWLIWMIYDHPPMRERPIGARLFLALGFAFGSLLTPFALTFNHYILASALLMMATRELADEGAGGWRRAARIGFYVSASAACDLPPAALFGAGVAVVWGVRAALGREKWPCVGALAAGAAPLMLLYAGLNLRIVGSPLPPNFHEEEMLYYPGSYWSEFRARAERGRPEFYSVSFPRRMFHSTLGHKGIYWMMPTVALASLLAAGAARRRGAGWAWAAARAAFPPAALLLTMRWAIDLSGGAYGIRHVFATLPPLYVILGESTVVWDRKLFRAALASATFCGVVVAAIGALNPWSHNTLSAIPPLENLARFCLKHPDRLATDWIEGLIESSSVAKANGWLDLGLESQRIAAEANPVRREWLAKAEAGYRRAIEAEPENTLPYYLLGIVQDVQMRTPEAIATYEKLLALDPKDVSAWNNLGVFFVRLGDWAGAKRAYAESQRLAPGNAGGDWGELMIEEREGRAAADSAKMRGALTRHPRDLRIRALARSWGAAPP